MKKERIKKEKTGKKSKAVNPKRKKLKKILSVFLIAAVLCASIPVIMNAYMYSFSKKYILTYDEASKKKVDCVLVLGAGVTANGKVSYMLKDRLDCGVTVYNSGCTDRILMSGDHGKDGYDEVNAMKSYAKDAGVESDNIFMDHAGFSTYESMYRAKEVFCVESAIIITQEYHLYRAIYDARKLGIEAFGVVANEYDYPVKVDVFNNCREFLARAKDICWCIVKPEPTYLGDSIPISSSGALTDDIV